jgi:hypothetical protein
MWKEKHSAGVNAGRRYRKWGLRNRAMGWSAEKNYPSNLFLQIYA